MDVECFVDVAEEDKVRFEFFDDVSSGFTADVVFVDEVLIAAFWGAVADEDEFLFFRVELDGVAELFEFRVLYGESSASKACKDVAVLFKECFVEEGEVVLFCDFFCVFFGFMVSVDDEDGFFQLS